MLPAGGTTALLLLLHLLAPVSSSVALASKPNFVIFFGDDWGWGDLGENNEEVRGLTPNLDQLAREGLRCTNFHVGASVCTPSRAALLTGRIGPRTGVTKNFGPSSSFGLPLTERTIAEVLKDGGWRTGMVGKVTCFCLPRSLRLQGV
jgi:arylsulfatase A-like enzyme